MNRDVAYTDGIYREYTIRAVYDRSEVGSILKSSRQARLHTFVSGEFAADLSILCHQNRPKYDSAFPTIVGGPVICARHAMSDAQVEDACCRAMLPWGAW